MIDVYTDTPLAVVTMIAIVPTTAMVAAGFARRWSWRAWPLALLSGLVVPVLTVVVAMAVFYLLDQAGGLVFHTNQLILLLGLPSALVGFGGAATLRHLRSKGI